MPSTNEIINDLDAASVIANRSSTALWRLKKLLEQEELDNLNRHQALTLIEGLIPMPGEILSALKCAADQIGKENSANRTGSEPEQVHISLRNEYEDILRGKCSALAFEDASDDLLSASETLATISSIAGDKDCGEAADWLLTRAAYHTATLIKLSNAFEAVGKTFAAKA